jgi:NAD(P)-dependent dehydrogenase (short-subunit alcohol dehydrogenase family)
MLEGRVAIVTGGGGEIGGAICRRFGREGASVLVTDVIAERAETVANEIREAGGTAHPFKLDVGKPEECEAAGNEAVGKFGRLTTLVNAAATVTPDGTVETLTLEQWENTLRINLTSMFLMCKYAIPHMRKTGGGAIVNIASTHGQLGIGLRSPYCTSKAGVIQFTKVLAIDFGPENIRANTISPGPIDTQRILRRYGTREAANKVRGPGQLLGRTGLPDEIAKGAAFLASDEASFMTGTDLLLDGGHLAFKGEIQPKN